MIRDALEEVSISVEPELTIHYGDRNFYTGIEVGGEEVSRVETEEAIDYGFDTGAILHIAKTDEGLVFDWFPDEDEIIPLGYMYDSL